MPRSVCLYMYDWSRVFPFIYFVPVHVLHCSEHHTCLTLLTAVPLSLTTKNAALHYEVTWDGYKSSHTPRLQESPIENKTAKLTNELIIWILVKWLTYCESKHIKTNYYYYYGNMTRTCREENNKYYFRLKSNVLKIIWNHVLLWTNLKHYCGISLFVLHEISHLYHPNYHLCLPHAPARYVLLKGQKHTASVRLFHQWEIFNAETFTTATIDTCPYWVPPSSHIYWPCREVTESITELNTIKRIFIGKCFRDYTM